MRPGRPPGGHSRDIDNTLMRFGLEHREGFSFDELVKAAKRKGISRPTVWKHLEKLVNHGLLDHRRTLYHPSDKILGLHGYGGLFKVEIEPDKEDLHQSEGNPLANADTLFQILAQKFSIVFRGYLNLLGMVGKVDTWTNAHALFAFLLSYQINDELLRLVHEVWAMKGSAPLKKLDGKRVAFTVGYADNMIRRFD
jgi:AcrR family transcriptional regulator